MLDYKLLFCSWWSPMVIVLEKRYRSYVRVGTDLSQLSLYSV